MVDIDEIKEFENLLYDKIKILNETLWDNRAQKTSIENWLTNFSDDKERINALFLLSKFMYFGATPIRNLLKSLYRDLYKYPLVENIRLRNANTLDNKLIEGELTKEINKTRFLCVGNPSESGAHLLYYFRQENKLSKNLFVYTDEVVSFEPTLGTNVLRFPDVDNYVFIDDFCGSGSQVTNDSNVLRCVTALRVLNPTVKISYTMLFSTIVGVSNVKKSGLFDKVESVIILDETFKCFSTNSRIYSSIGTKYNFIDQLYAKDFCSKYGKDLFRTIGIQEGHSGTHLDQYSDRASLGWGDCQLLIGLYHNTPDNTLPIIWYDEDYKTWIPIFKRYNKKYNL